MRAVAPASAAPAVRAASNGFDVLRLVAALLVIVGHSFTLTGHLPAPRVLGVPIHTLGVFVFFSLSGYLVTRSWTADPHPARFAARRALRMVPALAVVVCLTAFVFGPVLSERSALDYLRAGETHAYLLNMVFVGQYHLPGVFSENVSEAVNGSLWTLWPEVLCYALIAGGMAFARRNTVVAPAVMALIAAVIASTPVPRLDGVRPVAEVVVFFAIGALIARSTPPRSPLLAPVALCAWITLATTLPEYAMLWAWLFLPVIVVGLGHSDTAAGRALQRLGDPSYGTYLWGFLVQQIVVDRLGPALPLALHLAIAVPCTVLIGFGSWFLVERPALRLKPSRRPVEA